MVSVIVIGNGLGDTESTITPIKKSKFSTTKYYFPKITNIGYIFFASDEEEPANNPCETVAPKLALLNGFC